MPSPKCCAPLATGGMDVSDGLVGDLGKMCRAADVSRRGRGRARAALAGRARGAGASDPTLIETALTGGDDFEVLPTRAGASASRAFGSAARRSVSTCTAIGDVRAAEAAGRAALPRRTASRCVFSRTVVQSFLSGMVRAQRERHRSMVDRKAECGASCTTRPRYRPSGRIDTAQRRAHALCGASSARAFRRSPYLRATAPRRALAALSPSNTCDGGAGDDNGIARNWAALDAVELVPRYGVTHGAAAGRGRAVRPPLRRADRRRADGRPVAGVAGRRRAISPRAAQRARIPYVLGTVGGMTIEQRRRARARRASGSSSIALRATTTPSASTWCAAPTPPARMRWCSRSTCRCAPRVRARWPPASPRRSSPDLRMLRSASLALAGLADGR